MKKLGIAILGVLSIDLVQIVITIASTSLIVFVFHVDLQLRSGQSDWDFEQVLVHALAQSIGDLAFFDYLLIPLGVYIQNKGTRGYMNYLNWLIGVLLHGLMIFFWTKVTNKSIVWGPFAYSIWIKFWSITVCYLLLFNILRKRRLGIQ